MPDRSKQRTQQAQDRMKAERAEAEIRAIKASLEQIDWLQRQFEQAKENLTKLRKSIDDGTFNHMPSAVRIDFDDVKAADWLTPAPPHYTTWSTDDE